MKWGCISSRRCYFSFLESWGYFSCSLSRRINRVTIQPFRGRHATLCVLLSPKYVDTANLRPSWGHPSSSSSSLFCSGGRRRSLSLSLCVEISEICLTCVGRLVARSTVKRNGQQLKCIVDAADALLQTPCASPGWAEYARVEIEKLRKLLKRKRFARHDRNCCAFGGQRAERRGREKLKENSYVIRKARCYAATSPLWAT